MLSSFSSEFFLTKVSHKRFLVRQYQYNNVISFIFPSGFLKGIFKTYSMPYLLFSSHEFFKDIKDVYSSSYFSHWVLEEVIPIMIQRSHYCSLNFVMSFTSRFTHELQRGIEATTNICCIFSPDFSTGFYRSFNTISTHHAPRISQKCFG